MSEHGPCEGEGNGDHDEERLEVGAKGNRQQDIHGAQGDQGEDQNLVHELLLALGLANLIAADTGETVFPALPILLFEAGIDLGACGRVRQFGADRGRPHAIAATDLVQARSELHFGDSGERNFAAIGGTDAQIAQRIERSAAVLRQAQHDADILAVTRKALDFLTIEGLSHLAGDILKRQAESLGVGTQVEAKLLRRGLQAVNDIISVIAAQLCLQIVRGRAEHVEVRMADGKADAAATIVDGAVKAHFLGIRDRAHEATDRLSDLCGRQIARAFFRIRNGDPGTDPAIGCERRAAFDHVDLPRILATIVLQGFVLGRFQLHANLLGARPGRALGQSDADLDRVILDVRHEDVADTVGGLQRDRDGEDSHEGDQGGIAVADRRLHEGAIDIASHGHQREGNAALDGNERTKQPLVRLRLQV